MNKKNIIGIFILVIFSLGLFGYILKPSSHTSYNEGSVFLNNEEVRVRVARTEEDRRRGLMFESALKDGTGVLFVFEDKKARSFWNKNTYVPLDVIWIDNDEVAGISHLPPNKDGGNLVTVDSQVSVNYVLEVPYGFAQEHAIFKGTKVRYAINF